MNFLRDQFNQELDDEGEVVVAGESFLRHDILNGLAPTTYEVAFAEWIEQRKERLLEKADEILNLYDNKNRFEQLFRAFRLGGMLPFIGAGISIPSGFPSWTKFLFNVCDESHVDSFALEALLTAGEYEEAADLLYDDLGDGLFDENVQSTFDLQRTPVGPINYLPLLFPGSSILTTNFDSLIETTFAGDGLQGFDVTLGGSQLSEANRIVSSGTRALIKLHGDCRRVSDRVLLKREYESRYDSAASERFFEQVIFGRSFLFLGCSLCSDRTVKSMAACVSKIGAASLPRHFAFLELKTSDDRIARKKALAASNIFPIWYPEGEHDESLEALFLKLLEES